MKGAALTAGAAMVASAGTAMADNVAAPLPESWDYEADVVIVGYGAAGAAAAREAIAQGVSAVVLEKCDEFWCGGSTCASAGAVFPNDVESMYNWSRGYISREEIGDVVNSGLAMAGWLDANGLDRGDGGKGTYGSTKQIVDACGPNVLYETPAKRLVVDPLTHEVFGVIAEDAQGNEVAVKANKGVLLASGGFLGNEELVHRFVVPREVGMLNQGAPTCTGDGLLMAVSAGAALKNLNWMCLELNGQASIAYTKASEEIGTAILHTAMDSDKAGARIIVNQKGQRFMDEDKEFIHTKCNYAPFDYSGGFMAYEGFANLPMYLIFDSQLMDNVRLGNGGMLNTIGWAYAKDLYTWSEDNKAELERGWFVQADTIEELVEKLAEQSGNDPIDAEVLKQTIETYNGYCADGVDADFHRAEKPNMHYGEPALVALGEPPYYACQVSPCAIYTIGGLHWGPGGATLDWDGNPIPGLYHAGDVGQYSEISVVGIEDCMGMGIVACRTICGQPSREIPGEATTVIEPPSADQIAAATIA